MYIGPEVNKTLDGSGTGGDNPTATDRSVPYDTRKVQAVVSADGERLQHRHTRLTLVYGIHNLLLLLYIPTVLAHVGYNVVMSSNSPKTHYHYPRWIAELFIHRTKDVTLVPWTVFQRSKLVVFCLTVDVTVKQWLKPPVRP